MCCVSVRYLFLWYKLLVYLYYLCVFVKSLLLSQSWLQSLLILVVKSGDKGQKVCKFSAGGSTEGALVHRCCTPCVLG